MQFSERLDERGGAVSGRALRWAVAAYRGEQQIDFPRLWRRALIGSLAAVLISVASFGLRGVDLGIEFEGGTSWEVPAPGVSVAEARDALRGTGAADAKIQTVGGDTIRVRADIEGPDAVDSVRTALAELAGVTGNDVSVTTVGPSWGSEITAKARTALIAFFAIVAAYIALRLEWKMAVGALLAVAHDIVLSVGFYSLFQFEITPATVIAFLTIMGYSLYDTIVVYDKVREVVGRVSATGRYTYTEMMNLSLNQVLMRSVNTSITSMIPVASMLIIGSFVLGAVTLQEFSIALLVGIVVGTYSSLFVAAAVVARMKEREPAYVEIAERIRLRGGGAAGAGAATRTVAADDAVLGEAAAAKRSAAARRSGTTTSRPGSSSSRSGSSSTRPGAGPNDRHHPAPSPQEEEEAVGAVATVTRVLPWRRSARRPAAAEIAPLLDWYSQRHRDGSPDLIVRAFDVAAQAHEGQMRLSGEPYIRHPLAVAGIVARLGLDDVTIAASLLHDAVEDTDVALASIEDDFGPEVARIVDGVTKLDRVHYDTREQQQAASVRKMIVAIARDLRVLIIKLADRLHNLRTLAVLPAFKQDYIARETLDV